MPADVALGVRHHTGWAVMVVIGGDARRPVLVDRQRLNLMGSDLPREAYHVAANLPAADGKRLVAEASAAAVLAAGREVSRVKAELKARGHSLIAVGIAADVRKLPPLERILHVHTLRHSAEGEMFRAAIADACTDLELEVIHTSPKDIKRLAATELSISEAALDDLLAQMGREAGPPWQQDHRQATVAAMLALASVGADPVRRGVGR